MALDGFVAQMDLWPHLVCGLDGFVPLDLCPCWICGFDGFKALVILWTALVCSLQDVGLRAILSLLDTCPAGCVPCRLGCLDGFKPELVLGSPWIWVFAGFESSPDLGLG